MKTSIIIVAAGKGERFGQPKWSVKLAGKTLLEWCLETVSKLEFEKEVIVVMPFSIPTPSVVEWEESLLLNLVNDFSIIVGKGGNTRYESVKAGMEAANGDLLIIHNVANPLASVEDFTKIYELLCAQDAACFVGQTLTDTIRKVTDGKSTTIDRKNMWRVQTPQGFRKETLLKALSNNKSEITDEISLFDNGATPVIGIETSELNRKITFPEDLVFLDQHLRKEVLVGIGEDSHYFDKSGTIVLGGIKIDGIPKLQGNSDGDLILHALFNAVSSALGERSLGITADPMAEQGIIDSSEYLQVILKAARDRGFIVGNVSISLECSNPRIDPLVDKLKDSLSQLLTINPQLIGITATSGEGLTPFGRGEGMKCVCMVNLVRFSK